MKRIILLMVGMLMVALWPGLEAEGVVIKPIPFTLHVTMTGRGNVMSNPPGIDCTDGAGTCSHEFNINTIVALLATPPPPDEFGSYGFGQWTGDASGTLPATAVKMDADKTVNAGFTAVGIPIALIPLPPGQGSAYYHPVAEPVVYVGALAEHKPVGIGDNPGIINLRLWLLPFVEHINVYVGLTKDGWDDMLLFVPSGFALLSNGLVALKTNWQSEIDESLTGDIPEALLPEGTYRCVVMVTETGNMAHSFAWETYFEITHAVPLNPFVLP